MNGREGPEGPSPVFPLAVLPTRYPSPSQEALPTMMPAGRRIVVPCGG